MLLLLQSDPVLTCTDGGRPATFAHADLCTLHFVYIPLCWLSLAATMCTGAQNYAI